MAAPVVLQQPTGARRDRLGSAWAIATPLLDRMDHCKVESPHLGVPGFQVLDDSVFFYPDPWATHANRAVDQRVVFNRGERKEWALRASVAVPAPGRATWTIPVPPGGRLRFGWAATTLADGKGSLRLRALIADRARAGSEREIWSAEPRLQRRKWLETWGEADIDLSAWGGRTIDLTLEALEPSGSPAGYRDTALFGEPVIVTREPEALKTSTGFEAVENVLLIVVDALRADTIGPNRVARGLPKLFPVLEGLRDQGTNLTRGFASGNGTRLSTYAFLSSQYPRFARFHNERWQFTDEEKSAFYASRPPMLARLLRERGYRTAAIGNDVFLFGNVYVALDADFDAVIDHRHSIQDTPWMTDTASDWLRDHKDERFFLLLNYNAPHRDYEPPDEGWLPFKPQLDGITNYSRPYLGEVKYTGDHIGKILSLLDELELSERTLVILTSDHGEVMLARHDCESPMMRGDCRFNHGKSLLDEELHVPLIFRLPGRIPPGRDVDAMVSLIDLPPTILGLLGAGPHPAHLGRDLSKMLQGAPPPTDGFIRAEARYGLALRNRRYKYMSWDPRLKITYKHKEVFDVADGFEALYDLRSDPDEMRNAVKTDPAGLAEMRALLAKQNASLQARQTRPDGFAWNHVRLFGSGPFDGTLTVLGGRVVTLEPLGEGASGSFAQLEPNVIRISSAGADCRQARCGFRVLTEPPVARLRLDVTHDGETVDSWQLYAGPYGLHLVDDVSEVSPVELAKMGGPAVGPPLSPEAATGVYLWRSREGPGQWGGRSSAHSSVNEMMKAWGYR